MSIYIKDMEMPLEKPCVIQIYPEGTVRRLDGSIYNSHFEAVPVLPHGGLIDRHEAYLRFGKLAETLEEKNDYLAGAPYAMAALFLNNVEEFPTIIPAEED